MDTDLISEHFDIPYNDGDVDVQSFTIDRRESLDKWARIRHATIHLNIADVSLCFSLESMITTKIGETQKKYAGTLQNQT